ncbi:MAG: succinate dehydrogenase/fumarate reductase iron-sulfur subunit [Pelotomaculum sp. PtaB.Bin104]|nr:MAG: succinate dehydrogenase/fumarate reductase iron-sulfur subunit [Pelotomaculum sp. PtaB.Bin104]
MRDIIFFALLIIALSYLSFEIYRRIRYIRLGRPEACSDQRLARWKYFCQSVFLQKKIAEYPLPGLLHGFLMWGFIVIMLSSVDMAAKAVFGTTIAFLEQPWFLAIRDLFILLMLTGVLGFTARRIWLKYFRQNWFHSSVKTYAILLLIFFITTSELTYFTADALLMENLLPGAWLVAAFARGLSPLGATAIGMLMEISWWLHYLTIFTILLVIPKSRHLHLVFAPFNVYWRSLRAKGSLHPDFEPASGTPGRSGNGVKDFTRKQLLDTFSCVLCGRCHRECPPERSKEWLKPKKINGFIRTYLEEEGQQLLNNQPSVKMAGGLFDYDFIWNCTTCGGCNEACPVNVDHLSKIIDMRRSIVAEEEHIPPAMQEFFNNVEQTGNPIGRTPQPGQDNNGAGAPEFPSISEKPGAEYLLFAGCLGNFDGPTQKAATALAKILRLAGVDYALSGGEAWCCGETARRMGNERLFKKTARRNIAGWQKYGVRKIITLCPHCFNTIKNEYPELGGYYEVLPHAAFLAGLLRQGRLQITRPRDTAVTYHDPCYLGRYNDIFAQPRQVLQAAGAHLIEMPKSKKLSFCCGAGGGRFWTRAEKENRVSTNRAKEALATEADLVVTACPYCRTIFAEKTEQLKPGQMAVLDIAQFLLEATLEPRR